MITHIFNSKMHMKMFGKAKEEWFIVPEGYYYLALMHYHAGDYCTAANLLEEFLELVKGQETGRIDYEIIAFVPRLHIHWFTRAGGLYADAIDRI